MQVTMTQLLVQLADTHPCYPKDDGQGGTQTRSETQPKPRAEHQTLSPIPCTSWSFTTPATAQFSKPGLTYRWHDRVFAHRFH